jgi:hypothetical protein
MTRALQDVALLGAKQLTEEPRLWVHAASRQITANKVAWLKSEVDAWIASRPTAQHARAGRP